MTYIVWHLLLEDIVHFVENMLNRVYEVYKLNTQVWRRTKKNLHYK